jgi:predicted PurR-regulated permease PerM
MAIPIQKATSASSLAIISNILLSSFIFATLYFGRELLVPLALAALLTFMLAPLVTRLERWIGRIGAVLLVVAMMFAATGAVGWILTRQAVDLLDKLPDYKENISSKLRAIQIPSGGPLSRVSETLDELKKDLPGGGGGRSLLVTEESQATDQKPVPVELVDSTDDRMELLQGILGPLLGPLGTVALVLVLLIFMLLEREDLRNRLIRLIGQGRISATSRAMDDAGVRVSKYLLMQLVVNVTYGIPVAIGLYFIGVPNAVLWGALATVLRFIPYVGPWIAAVFPIALSLAVSPGWLPPLLTVSLFVVLELVSNNVMEPWLYGSSTGVTPIALIVAALVWTWLWGPVGLVLATPLTVCLVVMGRHIPRLAFLSIALSDEESLTPAEDLYHRLHHAGEHDESEFIDAYLKNHPLESLFDSVLIPVVVAAETDHRLGLLENEQLGMLQQGLGELLGELEIRLDAEAVAVEPVDCRVACIPAKAYRDEMAGGMLARLLRQKGFTARNGSSKMMSGEWIGWVREEATDVVCISAVSPTNLIHARNLGAKLRRNFPDLKIMVGLWGNPEQAKEGLGVLRESGANEVVVTVAEAADFVAKHVPLRPESESPEIAGPAATAPTNGAEPPDPS